jgi:hypothetical protein
MEKNLAQVTYFRDKDGENFECEGGIIFPVVKTEATCWANFLFVVCFWPTAHLPASKTEEAVVSSTAYPFS